MVLPLARPMNYKGKVTSYKGMGLVNEVFAPENLESLHGDIGCRPYQIFNSRRFYP